MSKKDSAPQPLSGVRVLIGRARHQAGALSAELRKFGASVIEIPFIEIRKPRSFKPLDGALKNLASYDWLILTSANGVEAMTERMKKLRVRARALDHLRIAAIGPATKKAIEKHGIKVDVVPKEYIAESVVRSLKGKVKGKRVLLVRAKVARDVIPQELRKADALVDVVEAYETVVPQSSHRRLQAALSTPTRRPQVVTFTSSSTVKNFVQLLGKQRSVLGDLLFASIGPVTSATLREMGLRVDTEAKEYNIPGLIEAIISKISALRSPAVQANLRMQELLKATKTPRNLTPELKQILEDGFVERDGCLLLASQAAHSFGGDSKDPIGYEAFVNHIHVADFPQAWLFANKLVERLNLSCSGGCTLIVSFDGKDATVRFHRTRSGQPWLLEDVESYREEAIAVLRSR
jgi:uroporphyrinogen-III synthase